MSFLRYATPQDWVDAVLEQFDLFLIDHAAAEKKASGMAMSMLSHYPDRTELVRVMAELAIEELAHFREVIKLLHARGLQPGADEKDPYINAFRRSFRKGSDVYLLDRLLVGGIVEARGCERFGLVANSIDDPKLKQFYQAIAESEAKHEDVFVDLARLYFPEPVVTARLDELLDIEARLVEGLPIRPALH